MTVIIQFFFTPIPLSNSFGDDRLPRKGMIDQNLLVDSKVFVTRVLFDGKSWKNWDVQNTGTRLLSTTT